MQRSGNEITFVNILCAGNDLDRLFLAYIHLTDPHMVRVGMTDNGNHFAHNHIFDFCAHLFPGFYLLTENSQLFHIFLVGDMGQVYKFFIDPFSVQFHIPSPP